jgi:hypothetical protein
MTNQVHESASTEEIAERIQRYRGVAYQNQATPHILYELPFVVCPWAECRHSIAGIDFKLELYADAQLRDRLMQAWWKGPGLTGCCPGCGQHVLFTINDKQCVSPESVDPQTLLPDDWFSLAYILG